VLGTRFALAVHRGGRVEVAVEEGTVELSNPSGAAKVRAGQEAVSEVGSAPKLLQPEPSTPPAPAPVRRSVIRIALEPTKADAAFPAGGEPPTFYAVLDYSGTQHQPATLHAEVKNAKGEVVLETEEPLSTEQFRYTRRPVKLPVTEPGDYTVRFWLEAGDGVAEATARFVVRQANAG
jgi:hypothetical protein